MKEELIKIWEILSTYKAKSKSRLTSNYSKYVMGWNCTKRNSKIKLKDPIVCIPKGQTSNFK